MSRQCGDCQLCCTLLPVVALKKEGGVNCRFQAAHQGCAVYRGPERPLECSLWSCRWLIDDDATELSRPDQSHYVIDVMPDYISIRDDRTGQTRQLEVVQIWVDPAYPDAYRDPALRRWIRKRAKKGIGALIRYSPSRAFALFAPPLTGGQWRKVDGVVGQETHTAAEIARVLGKI